MTRIRLISLLACALFGTGLLAGCGGDDTAGVDLQQVIDETFAGDKDVNSADIDLSISVSAEGEQGGTFDASLSGPVQGEEDEFPQFDLTGTLNAEGGGQSIDFEGGLISTGDAAFVSYQGSDYEVPAQLFEQIKRAYELSAQQAQQQQDGLSPSESFRQGCEQGLTQAGASPESAAEACEIDFQSWLTNLSDEGFEDVEGTETIHIHADANVDQIVSDFTDLASAVPGGQIPTAQIEQVEEAITEASIDVFSGEEDRILRGLDLGLTIEPPEELGAGLDSVTIDFSLRLGGVNEPQTIEAPEDAQSLDDLLRQLGVPPDVLDQLGGGALGGGGLQIPGGGGGGAGLPPAGGAGGNEYLDCIAKAKTAAEINRCASLIE